MTIRKCNFYALTFFLIFFSFSVYGKTLSLARTSLKEGHRLSFDFQNGNVSFYGALKIDQHNFEVFLPETLQFQSNNFFFGHFNPYGTFRLLFYPMDISLDENTENKIFSPSSKLEGEKKLTGVIYSPTKNLSFLKTSQIFCPTSLETIGIFYNSQNFFINDLIIFNPPNSSTTSYWIDWNVFSLKKRINFFIMGGKIGNNFFSSSWYLQNTFKKNSSIFFNYSFSLCVFFRNISFCYTKKQGQNINEPLLAYKKLFPSTINKYSFVTQTPEKIDFEINYSISEFPGPKISGKSQRRIYLAKLILSKENFFYSKSLETEYSEKRTQIRNTYQSIKFEIPIKNFANQFSIETKNMKQINFKFSTCNLVLEYESEKSKFQATIKHTFKDFNKTLTLSFDQDQVVSFTFKMCF